MSDESGVQFDPDARLNLMIHFTTKLLNHSARAEMLYDEIQQLGGYSSVSPKRIAELELEVRLADMYSQSLLSVRTV